MLDLLFKGAEVVDGSGESARYMDVGVKDGRITLNVTEKTAKAVVDAAGLTLCPGFIDSHSHGDRCIGTEFGMMCKISQGITTEIGGQCGQSAFPVDKRFWEDVQGVMYSPEYMAMRPENFENFQNYADYGNTLGLALNTYSLVGHNTLRVSVMGVENREPTAGELELMKQRLKTAMEQGAMGLSSGLIYIPGVYCKTDELVELCKVIKPYGGIYATHMRNEGPTVVEAVKEAIYIAETAGVPLVISHHKVVGRPYWGKSTDTLKLVDEAIARGMKILLDQYPYEASMTSLKVCIPPEHYSEGIPALMKKLADPVWRTKLSEEMKAPHGSYGGHHNSGGFTGVFVASSPATPEAEGLSVAEYAEKIGKSGDEACFDLLLANNGAVNAIYFSANIEEVERIYCYPHTVVGTDGGSSYAPKGHPRTWASFIRPLREFAEEKRLVTFEQAIRKQTAQTAEFWGLKDRGRIAEGYCADLLLLDRSKLRDCATFKDSNQKSDGVEAVYVAGQCVYQNKELTGVYAGHVLRRGE